ncbi:glycoside hydrolase family 10 protein [Anabaena subtropica]|uniref:Family 10 glycosylhydrolase n=1 Tax=Anabaena subtropica FACHB-260 TaxID=2692884 RepID=A0ABR8CKP4_9NOST|nr:family 10 glycosylhydrolase [Anabaena subtropica]MBD2343070.1 family 10 glycosylhydrolase [Anabaena subtropica FACHB-260]
MKNHEKINQEKHKFPIKKTGFFIFTLQLIIFNCVDILTAKAAAQEPVLSVVQSQENTQHWPGIIKRLENIGVEYCVIPLASVRSVADWGDRRVLFLPNIETLTPTQAIALEQWKSKGGNLIASGPVGSLSTPGVRQLLKTLLGGYWGFSLQDKQQLTPPQKISHPWANNGGLFGNVHGGVLIPNSGTSQAVAVWNSRENPAAIVSTERATFLGWRWGTDTASTPELDISWLKAALTRYSSGKNTKKIAGGSQNCSTSVASVAGEQRSRGAEEQRTVNNSSPSSSKPTLPATKPPVTQEAIDQLEQQVHWDVAPNSNTPIDSSEAIALQQELENLIGRVESAHLAASSNDSNTNNSLSVKAENPRTNTTSLTPISNKEQVLAQARVVAKNIPQLVANKNYALARQQWLTTRANLWKQFPTDRRLAPAEIRSVWLDRGTIVRAGSEQELAKIFDRLAQAGINTIFFETVNAGYTIYPSKVAPQQNPLIRGWDPLASGVKLAHERGMELHAWVWTFAAGNQRHNELLKISPDYPGPVLAAHPEWANYDHQGKMIPLGQTKPFFDPANPELRQYLLKLYQEIITQYKVDGLQLDYIRYPFQDPAAGRSYGYGKAARNQFQQLTGVDPMTISPSQTQLWQQWTAFRTQQVDSFVTQVSQMLRQQRRNLILSVAVFPLPEHERIQKLQQRWEIWARQGDVDLIIPMTYAQDTVRFQTLAKPWIGSTQLGSTLLIPGIRLLSLPTLGAFDQLQLVRDLPVSGYALFAAENLNNELHKLFSNTQGKETSAISEPIPHREPFQSAVTRYIALKREWQLFLQAEKEPVTNKSVTDFHSQAEVVQNALNQLATSPSASKLVTAKANLTRFQSLFRVWMRQQQMQNSYQARAWENRLAIIERLLRYGERQLELHSEQITNTVTK